MECIEFVRNKCNKKLLEIIKDNNEIEKCKKIWLFLQNRNCFVKINIFMAYEILNYLGFSMYEIRDLYPQLIKFDNIYGKYIEK